jgi:acyl carrier protein
MIPSAVVALPDLPLTARGKIDRTALRTRRDEPPHVPGAAFSAARTATERRLTDIVGPLFGGVPVSVDDNLIAIGGHSLLLTKLVARVQDAFGVRLALRRVFDAPTVGGLAAEIDRLAASAIDAAARGAPIPRRSGGLHR